MVYWMGSAPYSLHMYPRAEKHLRKVSKDMLPRIVSAIHDLANNPRPHGCRKLTAREGFRVRVGHFRILYIIDDGARTVTVTDVRTRPQAYR